MKSNAVVRRWEQFVAKCGPEESVASYLAKKGKSSVVRDLLASLGDDEIAQLIYDLDFWARRQQIPPDHAWEWCVALAGRGFGKTWMGARWANRKAREGRYNGALIAPTASDYRNTMIRGTSGILALSPPWFMPEFESSKALVRWPNGIVAHCYSADKPDRLRGPNTGWCWGDEPASWKHEMAALDQIPLFNRLGTKKHPPQTLLTGTPRPLEKLEKLLKKPGTVLVTGSSLANRANLAPATVATMKALARTRWGQQEVLGRLLMDVPGAIFASAKWGRVEIDDTAAKIAHAKRLERRIIAVDPAPTSDDGADETGVIVEGCRTEGGLKKVSVLADLSGRASPREWATRAIEAYREWDCDSLVVELNSGGEMVTTLIDTVARELGAAVNVKPVRAKERKSKRAEPVSALAETGRIEFVGEFPKLEKQLTTFTGQADRRDDRADAFCWGVHELVFGDDFFAV